jgi:tetratricopeptide (TPR) repeat protein
LSLSGERKYISIYEQATSILEAEEDIIDERQRKLSAVYNGLGTSLEASGDFQKASNYYSKALKIERELKDKASFISLRITALTRRNRTLHFCSSATDICRSPI